VARYRKFNVDKKKALQISKNLELSGIYLCFKRNPKMDQNFNPFLTFHREEYLNVFLDELSVYLKQKISLETLITLFFNRSGSMAETSSEIIYFLDTKGLSTSDRQTLADIVQAVTALNIKCQEGKPIRARLKGRK
jgi:hypothetical protein